MAKKKTKPTRRPKRRSKTRLEILADATCKVGDTLDKHLLHLLIAERCADDEERQFLGEVVDGGLRLRGQLAAARTIDQMIAAIDNAGGFIMALLSGSDSNPAEGAARH
jgi:hypothetical protein